MLRSRRSILIAGVAGLALLEFGLGYASGYLANSDEQQQAAKPAKSPAPKHRRQPQQADTDRAGLPRFAERAISNPEPRSEEQREKRDLAAQEANAAWAFWMTVVAAVQAILGTVGIVFIWQTLKATRDAVGEAGNATKAAQATARAYIALERPRLVPRAGRCFRDTANEINIEVRVENIGKSTGYVEVIAWGPLPTNQPASEPGKRRAKAVSVHAEQTETLGTVIAHSRLDKLPYVGGYIEYRSPFQNNHRSYFCFEVIDGRTDRYGDGGPTARSDKGNRWPDDT